MSVYNDNPEIRLIEHKKQLSLRTPRQIRGEAVFPLALVEVDQFATVTRFSIHEPHPPGISLADPYRSVIREGNPVEDSLPIWVGLLGHMAARGSRPEVPFAPHGFTGLNDGNAEPLVPNVRGCDCATRTDGDSEGTRTDLDLIAQGLEDATAGQN
jgi:hypothetical protein